MIEAPLFDEGGLAWIPMPMGLLHAPPSARDAWAALMQLGGGAVELETSGIKLARVMGRGRRCCQLGLSTLEQLGMIERRGEGNRRTLIIRVRLERGHAPGGERR